MTATEPKLTVVVVSYNVARLLDACLAALRRAIAAAPDVPTKVVVVDNNSRDGSPDLVRERHPGVDLRPLDTNLGYGGGANVVLRELATPYALVMNPDTEVQGDAPAALVRFLKAHPHAGLAGGRLVYPDGSFQHSAFEFPSLAMSLLDVFPVNHRLTESRINGRYPREAYAHAFKVGHPLGACLCVRREAIEAVGGFDESYFMYAEELDLCWRIRQAGWEIWYTPDATIVHHEAQSTSQVHGEMQVQLHRSRYLFFAKHYRSGFGLTARAIVASSVLRDAVRDAWHRTTGRMSADAWRERRAVYGRLLAL